MATVTLTIDGHALTVEKGRTILEAALEHQIQVPFYCYHPALGVDGSCRVCIVEVEKMPKLTTACSTACADGMVVHTNTPNVNEARAGVFEFLLVNHPLDCPVCDKGGECPLQDYSLAFGPARSRMEFPRRVFDAEGAAADVGFGSTLMLNRNRCILCTRCVRFMRDVDGDAQIGIANRGADDEIMTFGEDGVHSLLSGNLMDICPVGALITRDYHFKSRPWDNLRAVDTICTACAKGCNTTVWIKAKPEWAKGPSLARITPRLNPAVNSFWMCDIGRFGYHWAEESGRLRQPLERGEDGSLQPAAWKDVLERVSRRVAGGGAVDRLTFLVSAHASLEEMHLVRRIASGLERSAGVDPVVVAWKATPKLQPAGTAFKVPAVDAPNVAGARDLGLVPEGVPEAAPDLSSLRSAVGAGSVRALYVIDSGPPDSLGDVSWVVDARRTGVLPLLIVQGVAATELSLVADFVLPGACSYEKAACYTNDRGLVQMTAAATPPPGEALEDWQILVNVARALGVEVPCADPARIRADIALTLESNPAYADLTRMSQAGRAGVTNWLEASNPSERWKWDQLFRDLPPPKFGAHPAGTDPVT